MDCWYNFPTEDMFSRLHVLLICCLTPSGGICVIFLCCCLHASTRSLPEDFRLALSSIYHSQGAALPKAAVRARRAPRTSPCVLQTSFDAVYLHHLTCPKTHIFFFHPNALFFTHAGKLPELTGGMCFWLRRPDWSGSRLACLAPSSSSLEAEQQVRNGDVQKYI